MRSPRTAIASSRRTELNGVLADTPVYTLPCIKMTSAFGRVSAAGAAFCPQLGDALSMNASTIPPRHVLPLRFIPHPRERQHGEQNSLQRQFAPVGIKPLLQGVR